MPEDGPYYRNMQRVWTKVIEFTKFVVADGSMYSMSILIYIVLNAKFVVADGSMYSMSILIKKRQIYRDARTLKVKAEGSSETTTTLPVSVASYPTRLYIYIYI